MLYIFPIRIMPIVLIVAPFVCSSNSDYDEMLHKGLKLQTHFFLGIGIVNSNRFIAIVCQGNIDSSTADPEHYYVFDRSFSSSRDVYFPLHSAVLLKHKWPKLFEALKNDSNFYPRMFTIEDEKSAYLVVVPANNDQHVWDSDGAKSILMMNLKSGKMRKPGCFNERFKRTKDKWYVSSTEKFNFYERVYRSHQQHTRPDEAIIWGRVNDDELCIQGENPRIFCSKSDNSSNVQVVPGDACNKNPYKQFYNLYFQVGFSDGTRVYLMGNMIHNSEPAVLVFPNQALLSDTAMEVKLKIIPMRKLFRLGRKIVLTTSRSRSHNKGRWISGIDNALFICLIVGAAILLMLILIYIYWCYCHKNSSQKFTQTKKKSSKKGSKSALKHVNSSKKSHHSSKSHNKHSSKRIVSKNRSSSKLKHTSVRPFKKQSSSKLKTKHSSKRLLSTRCSSSKLKTSSVKKVNHLSGRPSSGKINRGTSRPSSRKKNQISKKMTSSGKIHSRSHSQRHSKGKVKL